MEAMKMHELECNFILCLLQPNSRQLSQGWSHSLPPLSLCFLCCRLPNTRATRCHVSAACQSTRKQTDPKKELLPTQSASWIILPSAALLSDLTYGRQQQQASNGREEEQDQPFSQEPWLDWIRCDMKLQTVLLSSSTQRLAATMWECEVIQEEKAVLSSGMPHHYQYLGITKNIQIAVCHFLPGLRAELMLWLIF